MSYIYTSGVLTTSSPYSPLSPALITSDDYLLTTDYFLTPTAMVTKGPINISINPSYSTPLIGFYDDLNQDPKVRSRMVKYFYYKVLDKWLYDDLIDLLAYFKIRDGKVVLIDSVDDYKASNVDKDSDDIIKKKVEHIEKFFVHKDYIAELLAEYVNETGTNWFDLTKNDFFIKEMVMNKLRHRLRKAVSEKRQ